MPAAERSWRGPWPSSSAAPGRGEAIEARRDNRWAARGRSCGSTGDAGEGEDEPQQAATDLARHVGCGIEGEAEQQQDDEGEGERGVSASLVRSSLRRSLAAMVSIWRRNFTRLPRKCDRASRVGEHFGRALAAMSHAAAVQQDHMRGQIHGLAELMGRHDHGAPAASASRTRPCSRGDGAVVERREGLVEKQQPRLCRKARATARRWRMPRENSRTGCP